jgi:hypothetical protein
VIRLAVRDSPPPGVPALGARAFIALVTLLLLISSWYLFRRRNWTAAALVLLCVGGMFIAMGAMWSDKPAPTKPVRFTDWPADSHLARNPEYPTLIMFADPDCACTKAGLKELRELMSAVASKARGYVVFTQSVKHADGLSLTDNWISASSIQGVMPVSDQAAREAELFGATTSGQVLLYSPDGELLFSGGIAPAMGQVGENPMARALTGAIEAATEGKPKGAQVQMLNSVRGCSLRKSKK